MTHALIAFAFLFATTTAYAERPSTCGRSMTSTAEAPAARSSEPTRAFKRARGYAILVGAMVASAAATTYLTSLLPADLNFLSQLIAQMSAIGGVYVFGAPILEPINSAVRKFAFGLNGAALPDGDSRLDLVWRRTQNAYGVNQQMSRGVVNAFITSVRQNFYEAKRAIDAADPRYAADQVAEAAVRLRKLYVDLDPADESVTLAVRSSFTAHVAIDDAFRTRVHARIAAADPQADEAGPAAHYAAVLSAWL